MGIQSSVYRKTKEKIQLELVGEIELHLDSEKLDQFILDHRVPLKIQVLVQKQANHFNKS